MRTRAEISDRGLRFQNGLLTWLKRHTREDLSISNGKGQLLFCTMGGEYSGIYYLSYPFLMLLGMVVSWINTRREEAIKGTINRVSEQLREFYGPLHSIVTATESACESFRLAIKH